MVRVDVSPALDDLHELMVSAFRDDSGGKTVVVCVNSSDKPVTLLPKLAIGGQMIVPQRLVAHVTSGKDGDDLKAYPPATGADGYVLPARSVTTLEFTQ